jgi:hypothetical protein
MAEAISWLISVLWWLSLSKRMMLYTKGVKTIAKVDE